MNIYNKIKHYKIYIKRYGCNMLIKHYDYPTLFKRKELSTKKFKIHNDHKYTKKNNVFLL